jgi:hypothetical protein
MRSISERGAKKIALNFRRNIVRQRPIDAALLTNAGGADVYFAGVFRRRL